MRRLIKPDPYDGFKDDRERRRALNTRARSYAAGNGGRGDNRRASELDREIPMADESPAALTAPTPAPTPAPALAPAPAPGTPPAPVLVQAPGRLLAEARFRGLAAEPAEIERFANTDNPQTCRACQGALKDFRAFVGISRDEDFREATRARVIDWRKSLRAGPGECHHSPQAHRALLFVRVGYGGAPRGVDNDPIC